MELPPPPSLFVAIQFSLLLITASSAPHRSNLTDLESLLAFKAHVIDPYGILATNWTTNTSFCSWTGVSCSHRRQRVTGISLNSVNLQGTISPHISNLSFLSHLSLSNNTFTGTIPETLARLPRLAILDLGINSLSGPIPPAILNMSSLTIFAAAHNNLSGSVHSNKNNIRQIMFPPLQKVYLGSNQLTGDDVLLTFARYRGLQLLDLDRNQLTGTIPTEIGNLPELNTLYLGGNQLTGTIPASLGNLTKLVSLDLAFNSLVGVIPEELLTRLSRLAILDLQANSLSGPIPPAILNMPSLTIFVAANNNLSGSLRSNNNNISLIMFPPLQKVYLGSNQLTGDDLLLTFARCQGLQFLDLDRNQLTGTIPTEIGNLPELNTLYLGVNQLTGTIPASLGNLTKLVSLDLSFNSLEGVIPEELGNLRNLGTLSLGSNSLIGSIPKSLVNNSMLYTLILSINMISGKVPIEIGKSLPELEWFDFGSNQLTGGLEFLSSLSYCKHLQFLGIEENQLEGVLQDSIGNLSMFLNNFDASHNRIHGNIPNGLGNLTGLVQLHFTGNELTGAIPPTVLAGLERLQLINLSVNKITGSIPIEFGLMTNLNALDLDDNALSGSIPSSLANISRIQALYLSHNKLSSIPESLWTLESLIYLNLSMNAINGSLSAHLGKLKALDTLDLSMNQLSGNISGALGQLQMLTYLDLSKNLFQGEIPESFGGLISVTYLNLSHNFLSGVIPKSIANLTYLERLDLSFNKLEGQVPKGRIFSNISISSLMGNEALCGAPELHLPPCPTIVTKNNLKPIKYILLATGVVLLTCICLMCTFYWMKKKKNNKTLVNTYELRLDDYRVVSHHELVRATENFADANLLGRGAFGSVFRGCLDDGLVVAVKVLNLEVEGALKSFEAECRALKMVRHKNLIKIITVCSNLDFKALVLQFMPNGSLEDWLYSDNYCLNLLQRVNIMVDVSLALEYLHHHHPNVVLHCDLKPRNVLLDEEMVAHVSDFGISKLLYSDSRSITSTSKPGTIGYIAPEYAFTGAVSKMGDVYSFGILLLETFTGRRTSDAAIFGEDSNLREWVCNAHPASALDVVDHNLLKDDSNNDLTAMHRQCLSSIIELGLLCSRYSPKERIPMTDVVVRLQKIKMKYLSSPNL